MLKTVLFDIGGTLVSYQSPSKAAKGFEDNADEIGADKELISTLADEYLLARKKGKETLKEATFADALESAEKKLGTGLSAGEKESIILSLYSVYFRSIASLYDGAEELMAALKERELEVGLISNTPWPGKYHEEDLHNLGILDDFSLRIWSSKEGIRKPHSELFEKALSHFGTRPSEAVYIGDMFDRDVVGANGVNMPAIWINSGEKEPGSEFNGFETADLHEVLEVINSL